MPDIFDPSIFLKTGTTQSNQTDTEDSNFLLESNINTLEEGAAEKSTDNSYLGTNKVYLDTSETFVDANETVDTSEVDQIQSIINKNIEYLKNDDIPGLRDRNSKVESSFSQNPTLPRLLSPIDKHLQLFAEGSKSKLHSPLERSAGYLQDGQLSYSSGSFMYSSNPSIPYSCSLSTDLLNTIPASQYESQPAFSTNIEECRALRYLDLAKKDPFFGQNLGLSQINTKDPFLINTTVKTAERVNTGLQKSQITRSCEDLQASPTLQLHDGNYFNFPSMLDEPTQLDYLDLATLDFLTNPNLISVSTGLYKEKPDEKEDAIYSEDNLICQEPSSICTETAARNVSLSEHTNSAFSKIKNKKLRLKKSKCDIEKRIGKRKSESKNDLKILPDIGGDSVKQCNSIVHESVQLSQQNVGRSFLENKDYRKCRKRKLITPRVNSTSGMKSLKMNKKASDSRKIAKSENIFNVREQLTHFTEEQKDSAKAVIGQTGCIYVKKKRSLSCDEPVVYVNDSQINLFGNTGAFSRIPISEEHSQDRNKFHPTMSHSKALELLEQSKTKRLTSVLQLKCQECSYRCRSVFELKNHGVLHVGLKQSELQESTACESDARKETLEASTTNLTQKCSNVVYDEKGISGIAHIHRTRNSSESNDGKIAGLNGSNTKTEALLQSSKVYDCGSSNITHSVIISDVTDVPKDYVTPISQAVSLLQTRAADKHICDVPKDYVTPKSQAVSLLLTSEVDKSVNLVRDSNRNTYLNHVDTMASFTSDLNKETALAIQAIGNINDEFQLKDDPFEDEMNTEEGMDVASKTVRIVCELKSTINVNEMQKEPSMVTSNASEFKHTEKICFDTLEERTESIEEVNDENSYLTAKLLSDYETEMDVLREVDPACHVSFKEIQETSCKTGNKEEIYKDSDNMEVFFSKSLSQCDAEYSLMGEEPEASGSEVLTTVLDANMEISIKEAYNDSEASINMLQSEIDQMEVEKSFLTESGTMEDIQTNNGIIEEVKPQVEQKNYSDRLLISAENTDCKNYDIDSKAEQHSPNTLLNYETIHSQSDNMRNTAHISPFVNVDMDVRDIQDLTNIPVVSSDEVGQNYFKTSTMEITYKSSPNLSSTHSVDDMEREVTCVQKQSHDVLDLCENIIPSVLTGRINFALGNKSDTDFNDAIDRSNYMHNNDVSLENSDESVKIKEETVIQTSFSDDESRVVKSVDHSRSNRDGIKYPDSQQLPESATNDDKNLHRFKQIDLDLKYVHSDSVVGRCSEGNNSEIMLQSCIAHTEINSDNVSKHIIESDTVSQDNETLSVDLDNVCNPTKSVGQCNYNLTNLVSGNSDPVRKAEDVSLNSCDKAKTAGTAMRPAVVRIEVLGGATVCASSFTAHPEVPLHTIKTCDVTNKVEHSVEKQVNYSCSLLNELVPGTSITSVSTIRNLEPGKNGFNGPVANTSESGGSLQVKSVLGPSARSYVPVKRRGMFYYPPEGCVATIMFTNGTIDS